MITSRRPGRRIRLAWRNLAENPFRLAASVAGAGFAVVLMFLQNGFRNALLDNMVAVVTRLDGDLFITHRSRYILSQPMPIPYRRLERARAAPGVLSVHPFYLEVSPATRWRDPATGLQRPMRVLAYRPDDDLFDLPEARAQREAWSAPDSALVDRRSKKAVFGAIRAGDVSELAGRRTRIVGSFELGTDFRANGTLLMSEDNLLRFVPQRLAPGWGDRLIDLGVVRVERGYDPRIIKQIVAERLPADCIVLAKHELVRKEQHFWQRVTPVGVVFDIGVAMGFIVGLAICYQVLATEIHDRLPQFAALKAMGYTPATLSRFVVAEGVILGLLGFAAGLCVSVALYDWLGRLTGLTMSLKAESAALVFALTIGMCVVSALLAARRLHTVDPADLFS
jgi:putative ABC transport system permease protein